MDLFRVFLRYANTLIFNGIFHNILVNIYLCSFNDYFFFFISRKEIVMDNKFIFNVF
jgi:hypothetical protein